MSDRTIQSSEHEVRSEHVRVNGITLHYLRTGRGPSLLLLHGWPEFSAAWLPMMERLAAKGFDIIAPDLRGFGDSDKPDEGPSDGADESVHAADMRHLLSALSIARCGIVGHDVGAVVGQSFAHSYPDQLFGLFFFDCPYPGIGARWAEPSQVGELWHLSFHQMPWAATLVGASRDSCRAYIGHFLRHWCGRKNAFDDVLEAWVDNFLKPGNLQGGFNWYVSRRAARLAIVAGSAPAVRRIHVPTCVRWGALDPALPIAWADRLGDSFSDLDFAPFDGAGHFPHREYPERAALEVAEFFRRRGAVSC
jgi:pimeloyl-ACP methyl ester carboxylesterase